MAALDWGLGHATRSVQIIKAISSLGGTPVLASAGSALAFWRAYFPGLEIHELPAYAIKYRSRGSQALGLMTQIPRLRKTIADEHRWLEKHTEELDLHGVISDNRYGLWSDQIPSIMVCHQLAPLPGPPLNWLRQTAAILHRPWLNRFSAVWVPDIFGTENLAGRLVSTGSGLPPIRYIGWLSRFETGPIDSEQTGPVLGIVSGPEPHRQLLVGKMKRVFREMNQPAAIVLGKPGAKAPASEGNLRLFAHLGDAELSKMIRSARLVVSRPGYSSLMDYIRLGPAHTLLIPTPGQGEQHYLSNRAIQKGWSAVSNQDELAVEDLEKAMAKRTKFPSSDENSLGEVLLEFFAKS